MPLLGTQWLARDVCRLLWDNHWRDANVLATMVAVLKAEAQFYEHAFHYNDPADGYDGSTDWGMFELNDGNKGGQSPDSQGNPQPGGTRPIADVIAFRDKAWDPYQATPIARQMFVNRQFQPWAAYGNGAYKQYVKNGCIAVCNMLAVLNGLPPII